MSAETLADWLRCPVCAEPLIPAAATVLGCANGHRYDINKRGYATLLGSRSRVVGDTPAMLDARSRVLERGTYAPIVDALDAALDELVTTASCHRRRRGNRLLPPVALSQSADRARAGTRPLPRWCRTRSPERRQHRRCRGRHVATAAHPRRNRRRDPEYLRSAQPARVLPHPGTGRDARGGRPTPGASARTPGGRADARCAGRQGRDVDRIHGAALRPHRKHCGRLRHSSTTPPSRTPSLRWGLRRTTCGT